MPSRDDIPGRASLSARILKDWLGEIPPVAAVLGTGWGNLLDGREVEPEISFEDAGFDPAGVHGHRGRIVCLKTPEGSLLVQDGRLHTYEGLTAAEAALPALALAEAGVRLIVFLSAAGGLNPTYMPGDLMIVGDHIMLWGENPLRGMPHDGERKAHLFTGDLYPEKWRNLLEQCLAPDLRRETGTYAFVPGPSFETAAEAHLLRLSGADAVGMSTAPEVLMARYGGAEAAALCCISNSILPYDGAHVGHAEVIGAVRTAAGRVGDLLDRIASAVNVIL